jgi:hypothetical protein
MGRHGKAVSEKAGDPVPALHPVFIDSWSLPREDRLLGVIFTLAQEVSVLSDRLDAFQRLASPVLNITTADLDAYAPDAEAAAAQDLRRRRFVEGLLRALQEQPAVNGIEEYEDLIKDVSQ